MPVAETLGGALFGSFLSVLFDRLSSRQVLDYFRGRKLDEKLPKRLKVELRSVNAVVEDAEQKQFSDSFVKAWLDDVRAAVFDAEDLLDEIDYEVSKCMLEAESRISASFDREIESRMNQVLDELKDLAKQKDDLGLKSANTSDGVGLGGQVSRKLQSSSLVAESVIYGRQHEIDTVFNWLTPSIENGNQLSIISIVGMGGLGKTTLAQHVYNDPRMEMEEYKFGIKAWVCVSDDFEVFKVTRKILEAITKSTDDSRDLEIVQGRLKDRLIGERFLLVLDDVWNEKPDEWEALQTPLNYGAPGSKILVTTRSTEVASCMRSNETHLLEPLQDEQCWKLLAKHAFNDENLQLNPEFKNIGMQIVKKCDGLPLALKTIGGLLYRKSSVSEWESVLKSKIWSLPEQYNNIIPALLLSYYHLPSSLKRCFAFCALFPKDYEFDKEDLILLWMAENFLQCPDQTKSMEEVGKQYFDDLLSRSFFQQSSEDYMMYVMHDLLNDLAKYVCGDFCFRLGVEEQKISEKPHHFSICVSKFEGFKGLCEPSKLRTFLPLSWRWMLTMPTGDLFSMFRFVRVLSLSRCASLTEVPDFVCNLKHLRSLDLSYTDIEKLPDSTCFLFNLQILKLGGCTSLKELPLDLHKLTKLCHLDLSETVLRKFPEHLGKVENLQVHMGSICVGEGGEFNIQQLGELNLHGRLEISEMQNIVTPSDALPVNFKNKMKLTGLELKWSEKHDDSLREKDVLENLPPSKYLEELSIYGYGGTEFPSWLGNDSLSNVVSLDLHKCENCVLLPSLGLLPSLKYLSIIGLCHIVVIGAEFYGSSTCSFASLKTLIFGGMEEWEKWECKAVMGAFPCLTKLSIANCPKLKEHLPEQLPCLMELMIESCNQLVASLPRAPALQRLSLVGSGEILNPSTLKEVSSLERIGQTLSDASLESLSIDDLPNLNFPVHHCHNSLVSLSIDGRCDSITTFPLDFFPNLDSLILRKCGSLQMISVEDTHNHLRNLIIEDCPQFLLFPSAPRLEKLLLTGSGNLKSLPKQMDSLLPSLCELTIYDCPQVELISGEGLPSNLKKLRLSSCSKLVTSLKGALGANTCLESLSIAKMDIESFPDEGLLPLSLVELFIDDCPNLKKLDYKGLCPLSSLTYLWLENCPSIQCLPCPNPFQLLQFGAIVLCCNNVAKNRTEKTGGRLLTLKTETFGIDSSQ